MDREFLPDASVKVENECLGWVPAGAHRANVRSGPARHAKEHRNPIIACVHG